MQKLTVEELKRLLYDTFCDHLSMKDIENIIMTEENHIENPEDCQVDIDSKEETFYTFCPVFKSQGGFICCILKDLRGLPVLCRTTVMVD